MAKGIKTGGRIAGTPNKRTSEVMEQLKELGCDPIEGMARIAMDKSNSIELQAKMLAELAPYVYAKRKAIEISGNDGVTIIISRDDTKPKLINTKPLIDEQGN